MYTGGTTVFRVSICPRVDTFTQETELTSYRRRLAGTRLHAARAGGSGPTAGVGGASGMPHFFAPASIGCPLLYVLRLSDLQASFPGLATPAKRMYVLTLPMYLQRGLRCPAHSIRPATSVRQAIPAELGTGLFSVSEQSNDLWTMQMNTGARNCQSHHLRGTSIPLWEPTGPSSCSMQCPTAVLLHL